MGGDACARAQGRTAQKVGHGRERSVVALSLSISHNLSCPSVYCVLVCHAVIVGCVCNLTFALYVQVKHERFRVFDLATHLAHGLAGYVFTF